MFAEDDYGRRTLEYVRDVSNAFTAQAVRDLTIAELKRYGLDFVTSWAVPELDEEFSETVDLNTRPADYVAHYDRTRLVAKDPVVNAMRSTAVSLTWSEVRERDLSKAERFIIEEAKDFGATDGLTIPVTSSDGWLGVFSPCGSKPDLCPRARAALEIVGIYSHQALRRFANRDRRKARAAKAPLTAREREMMRWVALGKTNDEIGVILGVERTTVKTLLARAQEKLDANCRTYAVVQALRFGELDMNF